MGKDSPDIAYCRNLKMGSCLVPLHKCALTTFLRVSLWGGGWQDDGGNTEGTHLALPAPGSSARLTVSVATAAARKRAVGCPPGVWEPPYPSPELLRPQALRALQQFLSGGHAKVTKRKLGPWQREWGRERPGPCPLGMECPWHVCKRLSHRGVLPCAALGTPEDHGVGETFTLILLPSSGLPHPRCTYRALLILHWNDLFLCSLPRPACVVFEGKLRTLFSVIFFS